MMIKGGLFDAWWGPKKQEGDEAQPARSNHDGKGLTLFDSKGVLGESGRVYADRPSGSPWAKEQVRLLLVRRYVSGIGHDEDHWCEMLVLKHCEDVLKRVGFAVGLLRKFDEDWKIRFEANSITLLV